jgi:hypothetical protein
MAETWPVWGMVKNGVVVPHNPLPEGILVQIVLPPPGQIEFTPEEQAEFDAWERASDEALVNFEKSLQDEERDEKG